jgi:hypothetical protein
MRPFQIGLLLGILMLSGTAFGVLQPYHFRLGVRGGGNPTWFTHESQNLLIDNTGIFDQTEVPNYADHFHFPWTIGMHLGYNISFHIEMFVDAEHTHADGRRRRYSSLDGTSFNDVYDDYNHWGVYFGARYFITDCGFCILHYTPFIGAKIGFRRYSSHIDAEIYESDVYLGTRGFYEKYTVPSLGGQFGFEIFTKCGFSFVLMVEAIYSGGMRGSINSHLPESYAPHISVGDTGPLFSIPFTIGINYTL